MKAVCLSGIIKDLPVGRGVAMDVARYKDALVLKRSEILEAGAGAKPVPATEGTSRRRATTKYTFSSS